MAANRQTAPPPVAQPPRRFVNINGDGSSFYYYDSNVTIQYFNPTTQRYGNYMPPFHEKQTFVCNDGTNFVFYPDGSGSYSFFGGTKAIAPGMFPWMPPAPVLVPIPIAQTPSPPRPIQQASPKKIQEEEDDSSDDDGKMHRMWKYGRR